MDSPLFQKNNESFICERCGNMVDPHPTSSRDHCPFCLYSKHVDINPGDRANACKGLLEPIGMLLKNNKKQIVYRCQVCHKQMANVVAPDDNDEFIHELMFLSW